MRIPAACAPRGSTVLDDLREGWHDFWSRTWLWAIVIQFGVVNAAQTGAVDVIGPKVANEHLGGAAPFGRLPRGDVGREPRSLSGLVLMRWRPRRLLFVATWAVFPLALPVARARDPGAGAVLIASARSSLGLLERSVRRDVGHDDAGTDPGRAALTVLAAYDMLGSFLLITARSLQLPGRSQH